MGSVSLSGQRHPRRGVSWAQEGNPCGKRKAKPGVSDRWKHPCELDFPLRGLNLSFPNQRQTVEDANVYDQ